MDIKMSGNSSQKNISFDEISQELETYLSYAATNEIKHLITVDGNNIECTIKYVDNKYLLEIKGE